MTIANFFFVAFREEFMRISICLYSASSPHSLMPCLLTDQNFANNFWKGSPKEQSCEIISKSDQWFQRRRFLKNSLKNSILLPWQPEFLMELNSLTIFVELHPRNIPGKFHQDWPSGFGEEIVNGRADRWTDGWWPITIPHLRTSCSGELKMTTVSKK